MIKYLVSLFSLFCFPFLAHSTADQQSTAKRPSDLKLNLNDDGSHYVKLVFLNQVWLRFNDSNPGTTIADRPVNETFDIGLRRTRLQFFGQLTDRVFFYTQFGMNNFNKTSAFPGYNTNGTPSNRKIAAFFHDALGEYEVLREGTSFLRIGGGLTVMNGLSRFTQPSVGTIMSTDVPVFAQATVDQTDQFGRKLAVYVRGQAGKINYRLAVADPFLIETNGTAPLPLNQNAQFSSYNLKKQVDAMLVWNIFDTEDNTTPGYMTGTYLGKRKVWNIETGLIHQKDATRRLEGTQAVSDNLTLWSVASYLDMPVDKAKGTAVSAYAGYFNTNYGKGYLRYNGIMNPATGTTQPITGVGNTHGNAYPMFGTGEVMYAQAGYKFKDNLLGEQGTLQPYITYQRANYDRIVGSTNIYNTGVNWLIKNHSSKLSLDFQLRPTYQNSTSTANQLERSSRRGAVTLQYQISI